MYYALEVWGYKTYTKLETVQHKAIKGCLGVGKTCPTPMIVGDSIWYPTHIRHKNKMLTFWNKLVNTDESRLIRKIFLYDWAKCQEGEDSWCKDLKCVFTECNLLHLFNFKQTAPDLKSILPETYFVN